MKYTSSAVSSFYLLFSPQMLRSELYDSQIDSNRRVAELRGQLEAARAKLAQRATRVPSPPQIPLAHMDVVFLEAFRAVHSQLFVKVFSDPLVFEALFPILFRGKNHNQGFFFVCPPAKVIRPLPRKKATSPKNNPGLKYYLSDIFFCHSGTMCQTLNDILFSATACIFFSSSNSPLTVCLQNIRKGRKCPNISYVSRYISLQILVRKK